MDSPITQHLILLRLNVHDRDCRTGCNLHMDAGVLTPVTLVTLQIHAERAVVEDQPYDLSKLGPLQIRGSQIDDRPPIPRVAPRNPQRDVISLVLRHVV